MRATVLIQADLMVCQAASATLLFVKNPSVVSTSMEAAGTGGLLQSPVPTRGYLLWTTPSTMSAKVPTSIETSAFLLVASGIKNFKL